TSSSTKRSLCRAMALYVAASTRPSSSMVSLRSSAGMGVVEKEAVRGPQRTGKERYLSGCPDLWGHLRRDDQGQPRRNAPDEAVHAHQGPIPRCAPAVPCG